MVEETENPEAEERKVVAIGNENLERKKKENSNLSLITILFIWVAPVSKSRTLRIPFQINLVNRNNSLRSSECGLVVNCNKVQALV